MAHRGNVTASLLPPQPRPVPAAVPPVPAPGPTGGPTGGPTRGLLLAGTAALVALGTHALVPALNPTLVAVALGLAAAGSGRVPGAARPGLAVASRRVLRVGIALIGLQLVLGDVLALGTGVLLGVVGVVVGGIAGTLLLARWLGVPAETGLLVACGFSICGAAAVAAVQGVRRSSPDAVATALALVVVSGTVAMLTVPLVGTVAGLDPVGVGAWAGASVHEVGQVVVAGGLLGGAALQVAVLVKLARVLMLAPVLAVVSWREGVRERVPGDTGAGRPPLVPGFVVAFLGCVALRSVVPLPGELLAAAGAVQAFALAAAMFALGTGLRPDVLRSIGRPLIVLAAAASAWVALLGLPTAFLAG